MLPAGDQLLLAGSYSSALARGTNPPPWPPATSTFPSGSSVAVGAKRAVAMLPAEDQLLVAGSYNSALAKGSLAPSSPPPPATSTLPLGSCVAVCAKRAVAM